MAAFGLINQAAWQVDVRNGWVKCQTVEECAVVRVCASVTGRRESQLLLSTRGPRLGEQG